MMDREHQRPVNEYFERFLPKVIGRSIFADLDNLSIIVSFVISDNGEVWTITLVEGQLRSIEKDTSPASEISYVLDAATLLEIVSGNLSPQNAFFKGRVKIRGDKLKGLKLAMIFDRFIREYPFTGSSN